MMRKRINYFISVSVTFLFPLHLLRYVALGFQCKKRLHGAPLSPFTPILLQLNCDSVFNLPHTPFQFLQSAKISLMSMNVRHEAQFDTRDPSTRIYKIQSKDEIQDLIPFPDE